MDFKRFPVLLSVGLGVVASLILLGFLGRSGKTAIGEPTGPLSGPPHVSAGDELGQPRLSAGTSFRYVVVTGADVGDCSAPISACLTIQYAVDQASGGDEILVATGVYTGVYIRPRSDITSTGYVTQIVYISKTVTIRGGYTDTNWSTSDPDAYPTTLDARGQGRVLYITGDISPTVEGLRITGGDASGLGGGPPWAPDVGGGLFVMTAHATLVHNHIYSNTAMGGGGLRLSLSDATLGDNSITLNTADQWGGGLDLFDSNATISANIVSSNRAGTWGGGMSLTLGEAAFYANVVVSNTADYGGGVSLYLGSPTLINNVINNNQANASGTGLFIAESASRLVHTTLAHNEGGDGSAIFFTKYPNGRPGSAVLSNTILVGHRVGISVTGANTVTVNGVLWHSTPITVSRAATATVTVDNQHWGAPAFAQDGYHITLVSAAMDAGVPVRVTDDIDGHYRPYSLAPDLGADEIIATTAYSDTIATLVFTDTRGTVTVIPVLTGTVTGTTTLVYSPVSTATAPEGLLFSGHAFDLDAYQSGGLVSDFHFSVPVTITVRYSDDFAAGLDENTLALYRWDGEVWVDAATTCDPNSDTDRHPDENWFSVPICHLSRFATFGTAITHYVFLPLLDAGGTEVDEPVYAAGFVGWLSADGGFDDWTRDGVLVAGDGTLQLDLATAYLDSDPYAPGAYHGHDFYNGASFWVGEALSPATLTSFSLKEAVASWNADTPAGAWVETLVRAQLGERWTRWYNLGVWAADSSTIERHSVTQQEDADGDVSVDTLVVTNETEPVNAFQLKLRLFSADGATVPTVRAASVAFSDTTTLTGALPPGNTVRWDRVLEVPECSQMVYLDGGNVWCSPTSTAMVLAYWAGDDGPCEPRVRAAVEGVYDWLYDGHGNWSFNTAYAATHDMVSLVARFSSLAQAEEWIAAGVPVVFSLAWGAGELTGAPFSWSYGHLLVLVGFDAAGDPVVNDPGAPSDDTVQRTYIRGEFESLWLEHTNGTVYLIYPPEWQVPALP